MFFTTWAWQNMSYKSLSKQNSQIIFRRSTQHDNVSFVMKIVVANKNDFVVVLMTCMKGVSSYTCYGYEVSNNIFVKWNNNTIQSDRVKVGNIF